MYGARRSVEYLPSRSGLNEQRRGPRKTAFADVWVDPGGTAMATAHKLLNISAEGAKLAVQDGFALPDMFLIRIGSESHCAKVVWRTEKAVGVRFEKPGIKVVSK